MIKWPYTQTAYSDNRCVVCGKIVDQSFDIGQKLYYPSSLYWNIERSEIYCGVQHSLDRHQEILLSLQKG